MCEFQRKCVNSYKLCEYIEIYTKICIFIAHNEQYYKILVIKSYFIRGVLFIPPIFSAFRAVYKEFWSFLSFYDVFKGTFESEGYRLRLI